MTETKITKAESLARTYAGRLAGIGWKTEVTVEHHPAEYYRHDPSRVMIPASVYASVIASGPNSWDDSFSFGWRTRLPAPEHHASTRFVGGHLYRRGARSLSRKLSLRDLGFRIASAIDQHRFSLDYAAHQGHELSDCIGLYRTNQACRHQVDTTVSDEQKSAIRRMAQVTR